MNNGSWLIEQNSLIARDTYLLKLAGNAAGICAGQFIDISLPQKFLRRPLSVCDWEKGWVSAVYRIVGEGTKILSELSAGQELDVLTGLGNGFDPNCSGRAPVLIGGGTGASPLLGLAKALLLRGITPWVLLGFGTKEDAILVPDFHKLGITPAIATDDGSLGHQGLVTELLAGLDYSHIYSCGPQGMMKALCAMGKTEGQYSLEARMGCGFGACMGCSIMTKNGAKRVCKDGPVFRGGELIW